MVESGEFQMFMGEYQHNLDTKGRIIIPAKFREELGETMIVTRWLDGCLAIYTEKQWQELYQKLQTLPSTKREARRFTHMIMAKAAECTLDAQGRIRLPQPLVKEAQLVKECVVIGVSDHVEIWDQERWNEYYAIASESFEDIAEELTEFF